VDEIDMHVAPLLIGAGTRLFEEAGTGPRRLEIVRVVESPRATHIRYRFA
jgi:hypothetical protein